MTGSKSAGAASAALKYEGHEMLRERLCLSLLAGREVHIKKIRETPAAAAAAAAAGDSAMLPGLQQHEASFIRLLCKISSGSEVYIHPTGTSLRFKPGLLLGVRPAAAAAAGQSAAAAAAAAAPITHFCHEGRGISYYLEPLLLLSPFCRFRVSLLLRGVTDAAATDPSVDLLRLQQLPLLQQLLQRAGGAVAAAAAATPAELKIHCRGVPGAPYGIVSFKGPQVARGPLQPLDFAAAGAAVKRVRGVSFAASASVAFARRAVAAARGVLNDLLPDVWVYVEDAGRAATGSKAAAAAAVAASAAAGGAGGQQQQLQQLLQQQKQQLIDAKVPAVGLVLVAEDMKGGARAAGDAILLDPATAAAAAAAPGDTAAAAAAASRATGNSKLQQLLKIESAKASTAAAGAAAAAPEEQLGIRVARLLLLQQLLGGSIPPRGQKLALLFAALADDVAPSKVLLSRLLPSTVGFLRLLRDFFGVAFSFEQQQQQQQQEQQQQQQQQEEDSDEEEETAGGDGFLDLTWAPQVLATCVGVSFKNTSLSSF
ncbi:hypothetical protein Emed_004823 [Eimeria media]